MGTYGRCSRARPRRPTLRGLRITAGSSVKQSSCASKDGTLLPSLEQCLRGDRAILTPVDWRRRTWKVGLRYFERAADRTASAQNDPAPMASQGGAKIDHATGHRVVRRSVLRSASVELAARASMVTTLHELMKSLGKGLQACCTDERYGQLDLLPRPFFDTRRLTTESRKALFPDAE